MELIVTEADWNMPCDECGTTILKGDNYLHDCSSYNAGQGWPTNWCKYCADKVIQRAKDQAIDYDEMRERLGIEKGEPMTDNNDDRKPVYWSCTDAERLSCDTLDEAVEEYLDDLDQPFPVTVEVTGYARMEVHAPPSYCRCLDDLLNRLDEEYGDPDGEQDGSTQKMKDAEEMFINAVIAEYVPWACEPICKETVNVQEWIDANRPDWRNK